jgi:hypothetical protein
VSTWLTLDVPVKLCPIVCAARTQRKKVCM